MEINGQLKKKVMYLIFLILVVACGEKKENKEVKQTVAKPNIVYLLADDLGYGDLSSYGQTKFKTPNIDALATRGIKFTQHYSGSSVCAPSRSSLMTGQHTGHTPIRGNKEVPEEGQAPLASEAFTIAEMLKKAGYTTGGFGKWGLGYPGSEGDTYNQGFDEFFGYNCQRLAHRYYPPFLRHNKEKVILEGNDWTNKEVYAPDLIQEKTLEFIEENKEKPFFAFVPFIMPHAELISPKDSILQKFLGKYEETPYTEDNPFTSDYGEHIVHQEYCPQETPNAVFASMVYRMDVYVGQIIAKLEELGLAENTIVMFASDNGPHEEGGANPEYFNSSGGLRGTKRDLYEGGIRSPFMVVWPNKIKPNTKSSHVSAFWDVMPTLAEITKMETPTDIDGISFLPTLLGENEKQKKHDYLYWEFHELGGRVAVRKGDWKGVVYNANNQKENKTLELYNLIEDPTESNNIADQHSEIVDELAQIMKDAHEDSELFPSMN